MSYIGYFIVSLLYNIVLLALYIVQTSVKHSQCVTSAGVDVSARYQRSFEVGLVILFIDFVNSNIVQIYAKFKKQLEDC